MVHTPNKLNYILHTLRHDPTELLRLAELVAATAYCRLFKRCVGKGTTVEPHTRIIHAANIEIGRDCLIKEGVYLRAGMDGGIVIKDRAALNAFCQIYGHGYVEVGEDTQIGPDVVITTTDHDYTDNLATRYLSVIIGKNVWISANVTVLPGVTIGDGAVIGAGAVVNRDVPAHSVAVGVPARVVKSLDPAETAALTPVKA